MVDHSSSAAQAGLTEEVDCADDEGENVLMKECYMVFLGWAIGGGLVMFPEDIGQRMGDFTTHHDNI